MAVQAGIRVEGARELRRTLKKASTSLDNTALKPAHVAAAQLVAGAARPTTPHGVTGRLQASVRSTGTVSSAIIRAGYKTVPYAGVQHFGWPARNIKAKPWIITAAQSTEPRWTALYEDAVQTVLNTIKGIS